MNTILKFLFGGIFMGSMLAILFLGIAFTIIFWIDFCGSTIIAMIPFYIVGGIIGIHALDE